jgi:hypothetical protein
MRGVHAAENSVVNRTTSAPHAVLALALAASCDVAAQRAVVTLPAPVAVEAPAAGVSTLTIDTRDTGVDLGLSRRGDALRGPAPALRRAASESGTVGEAAGASSVAVRPSVDREAVDGRSAPFASSGAGAAVDNGTAGTSTVDTGIGTNDSTSRIGAVGTAPMRAAAIISTDATTAADAAARSRAANPAAGSGRIVPAPR